MQNQLFWTKDMSVNDEELDTQHKKLFSIINKLIDIQGGRTDSGKTFDCLKELVDYTGYHFNSENKYMARHDFPMLREHIDAHVEYVKKMGVFLEDFEKGRAELNSDLLTYLRDWWTNHVLEEDMKYADYIIISSHR
ncbi:MAG: bacteriohemerythrin [Thermodesulfobacteriota bacterium]